MSEAKECAITENGSVYMLQAGMPVFVKTADVCAITGKSKQWIGQLVSQGTLSRVQTPHGELFDLRDTMQSYCSWVKGHEGGREPSKLKEERLKAELAIKKAKAAVAELEARELHGQMHRSEDVAALIEDLAYSVRGMLLALPGRLAVDAAALDSPAEVSELVRREAYQVLTEMSMYQYDPKKVEKRVRARRNWGNGGGGAVADEE